MPADAAATVAPRTAAEQAAERQAKATRDAEVQRYLERVPELTHYRYSPLEASKDPAPDA